MDARDHTDLDAILHIQNLTVDQGPEPPANPNFHLDRDPNSSRSDSSQSDDSNYNAIDNNTSDSDKSDSDESDEVEDEQVNNEDEDEEVMEAQTYVTEFFEGYRLDDLLEGPGKFPKSLTWT